MRISPFARECGFRNTGHFLWWNPKSWALTACAIQPKESKLSPTILNRESKFLWQRIRNLPQVFGIWNPQRGIQNPRLSWTKSLRRVVVPLYQKQRTKTLAEKGRNNITYNSNFLTYQCLLFCDFIQWQEKNISIIDRQVFQVSESMKRTFLLELPEQL